MKSRTILTICYYLFLLIWYIGAILLIFQLYKKNYKPYPSSFQEMDYKNLPSNLTPSELSLLMYHKIEPQVFTTTILSLIEKQAIEIEKKEQDYIFTFHRNRQNQLTRFENVVFEFLIGISEEFTLTSFSQYCGTKKGDSDFLFQYDLWKKVIRKESSAKQFFEHKEGYFFVKLMKNMGILLFIGNIVGGYHLLIGYGILIPAFFIPLFFYIIYKRTEFYQEEYLKWLAFQNYLEHIDPLQSIDIESWIMSAIVLKKIEHLNRIQPENEKILFAYQLNQVVLKCYRYAYLNGNRSISSLWNLN